jgi:hypothetical protein
MIYVGGEGRKCELTLELSNLREEGVAELMTALVQILPFFGTLWEGMPQTSRMAACEELWVFLSQHVAVALTCKVEGMAR